MQLSKYNIRDLNMYLSETYTMHEGKPIMIHRVEGVGDDGYTMDEDSSISPEEVKFTYSVKTNNGFNNKHFTLNYLSDEFMLNPIPMGYYNIDDYVVFFYRKQSNSYKKLPTSRTSEFFHPQKAEFQYLGRFVNFSKHEVLLSGQNYFTLAEAYEKLSNNERISAALHTNYALVKKGKYENFVIYYRSEPVIEYDGTNFIPLIDECHVTKFKLELGL